MRTTESPTIVSCNLFFRATTYLERTAFQIAFWWSGLVVSTVLAVAMVCTPWLSLLHPHLPRLCRLSPQLLLSQCCNDYRKPVEVSASFHLLMRWRYWRVIVLSIHDLLSTSQKQFRRARVEPDPVAQRPSCLGRYCLPWLRKDRADWLRGTLSTWRWILQHQHQRSTIK